MKSVTIRVDTRGRCDWSSLAPHAVRNVLEAFSDRISGEALPVDLEGYSNACPLLLAEAHQVAQLADVSVASIVSANVLYDSMSSCCACTAFSIEGTDAPLHNHCLDWDLGSDILREHSMLFRFVSEDNVVRLITTGWPGFLGAFVGVAPHRFGLTLNASWSRDARSPGVPLGMLLRQVLLSEPDYASALALLSRCVLTCDAILLLTGVRRGEAVVIERTPQRSAVRWAHDGLLVATNHYLTLSAGSNDPEFAPSGDEPFGLGSQERYREVANQLGQFVPRTLDECFAILDRVPFKNDLTLQRATLCAASGRVLAAHVTAPGAASRQIGNQYDDTR